MSNVFQRMNGFFTVIKLSIFHSSRISACLMRTLLSHNAKITITGSGSLKTSWVLLGVNTYLEAEGSLEIGNGTYFNRNCTVVCKQKIFIGEHCAIGPNVCIYDHDHAFDENGQICGEFRCADITIGNNVWIGSNAVILRGTNIGDNCVIGASAIISGTIPQNSLVKTKGSLVLQSLRNK